MKASQTVTKYSQYIVEKPDRRGECSLDMDIPTCILIIGRESSFTYLMHRYSTQSAHTAVFAGEHEDVLALARREHPAAIVLEIDPPENTRWTLVRMLKTHPETQHIPLVLCSWDDIERQCIDEGADVYLHKPILYQDFVTALTHIRVNGSGHE